MYRAEKDKRRYTPIEAYPYDSLWRPTLGSFVIAVYTENFTPSSSHVNRKK